MIAISPEYYDANMVTAPWPDGFMVSPSDTVLLPSVARGLFIGTAGDVTLITAGGTTLTFKNVPAGATLPVVTQQVKATSTTATNIMAMGLAGGDTSWVLSAGGVTAALDIDFVNGRAWNNGIVSIPSLLTCSRASTGYYQNANGTLTQFGNNILRYGSNGLLVEESRTNSFLRSQQLSQNPWSISNITIADGAVAAPDGTMTASKIQGTGAAGTFSQTANGVGIASGMTFSFFMQQGSSPTDMTDWDFFNQTTATDLYFGSLNLSTGVITVNGGSGTNKATQLANGWWRFTFTVTSGINNGDNIRGYVGSTGGIKTTSQFSYAWGAQLEAGAFATSYIPTQGSTVVRAADVVKIDPLLSTIASPVPGTVYCQASTADFTAPHRLWQFNASDSGNYVDLYTDTNPNWTSLVSSLGAVAVTAGTHKTVFAFANGTQRFSVDGGTVQLDTQSMNAIPNRLQFGNSSGSAQFWGGYIKRLAYFSGLVSVANVKILST